MRIQTTLGLCGAILQPEVDDNGSSIANLLHVFDVLLAHDADEAVAALAVSRSIIALK